MDSTPETLSLRLEVPLSSDPEGAEGLHYPWAHPVGSGVYLYLPYYHIKENCGKVQYVLDAPGVMFLNGIQPGPVNATDPAKEAASAVLFADPPIPHKNQSMYVDPAVGQPMAQELEQVFQQGLHFYRTQLPNAGFRPAGVVVGAIHDGGPVIGFGGDATNVIRMHYYNLPKPLAAALRKKLKLTLLHELAHRFHPESMARTALPPLPGEGAADFLRWSAALSAGVIDKAEAAEMFDAALANCLQKSDVTPWSQLEPRTRFNNNVPYDCGLVAYGVGLSMRQAGGSAMARMDAFFAVHARTAAFDFAHAVECSGKTGCSAKWLPRMFGVHETVTQVIDDWAAQTGLVDRVPEGAAADAPSRLPICADPTLHAPGSPACSASPAPALKLRYRVNIDRLLADFGESQSR